MLVFRALGIVVSLLPTLPEGRRGLAELCPVLCNMFTFLAGQFFGWKVKLALQFTCADSYLTPSCPPLPGAPHSFPLARGEAELWKQAQKRVQGDSLRLLAPESPLEYSPRALTLWGPGQPPPA